MERGNKHPLHSIIIKRGIIVMNGFNKKMNQMFGKMDERMMKMKINEALNMLKNGKQEELAKKLEKTDKKELLEKLKSVDSKTISDLNININEIKDKITEEDFKKMKNATDEDGKEIVDKIKNILK